MAIKLTPDDTVLFAGGDMTRVAAVAVDKYGQTVPGAKNVVALSVSGEAQFVGQSLIALEDGKTAFFVKTRAEDTGMVVCKAACVGLPAASARLRVTGEAQAALRRDVLGR